MERGTYAYNPGRAPHLFSNKEFPAEGYTVVPNSQVALLKAARIPVVLEGEDGFIDVWARNYPEKTPNQLLP